MKASTLRSAARRPAPSPVIREALPLATLWLAALLVLGGCREDSAKGEKEKGESKTATASEDSDEERPARRAPREDEGIDVPTEEDFEETVANQITPESDLQKELDQLEKEISE
jgi:hypothetical protein